jgi:hypothetical protein
MQIKANDEQVKEIVVNAILAAQPEGLGYFHYKSKLSRDEIMKNLSIRELGNDRFITADYFQGRMVKLHLREDKPGIWQTHRSTKYAEKPMPDYQSWCNKYPTYEKLFKSVEGVELI